MKGGEKIMELLLDIVKLLLGVNKVKPPSKEELAYKIDLFLAEGNGRDDGRIIRIKRNGYQYYITRSPIEGRGKY
jgi:hypothetical protein